MNYMDCGVEDHLKRQVRAAYGCSVAGQSPVAAGLAYRPTGCIVRPRCLLDCDNSSAAAAVAACGAI